MAEDQNQTDKSGKNRAKWWNTPVSFFNAIDVLIFLIILGGGVLIIFFGSSSPMNLQTAAGLVIVAVGLYSWLIAAAIEHAMDTILHGMKEDAASCTASPTSDQ